MSYVLYYSKYCKNCNKIIYKLSRNEIKDDVHFLCFDKRKNIAAIGMNYDGTGFYNDAPYPSWTLNSTTYLWDPPVSYPTDGKYYEWNESTKSWDETVANWPKQDK